MADLSLAHLEDLRTTLRKRGLSERTIRNAIDGSLRAIARDTYVSLALTNGVSLTWLSEQTGVAAATLLKHSVRFIHS